MDDAKKNSLLAQVHDLQGVKMEGEEGEGALRIFLALCRTYDGKAAGLPFDSEPGTFGKAMRDGSGER